MLSAVTTPKPIWKHPPELNSISLTFLRWVPLGGEQQRVSLSSVRYETCNGERLMPAVISFNQFDEPSAGRAPLT